MIDADRMKRLLAISELLRDRDLATLSAAQKGKAQTEGLLVALDHSSSAGGLNPMAAAQIVDRFGLWTVNRRILLNQQLARETVICMAAQSDAQRSFGRAEVLSKVVHKL